MSGHSKWSTIKHKKAATDAVRGKLFSKLSKAISIAIKTGGGPDPETNYKLRMAIETAKSANMPKVNIDRVLKKAGGGDVLKEVTYEGFGPAGVNVVVEVATDNRNRSSQEIKGVFERGGGSLAGPGAVMHNFTAKGMLLVDSGGDAESKMLKLIDMGVEDMEDTSEGIEVFLEPDKLSEIKKVLVSSGFNIKSEELVKKPKLVQNVGNVKVAQKNLTLLETLQEHDDVQKVYANIDIPDDILKEME